MPHALDVHCRTCRGLGLSRYPQAEQTWEIGSELVPIDVTLIRQTHGSVLWGPALPLDAEERAYLMCLLRGQARVLLCEVAAHSPA
ncbi:hypothetical protein ADL00_40535 [Streptomyces sp. AS58]|nr:hypothetical protein ADL00_40535 [Streptomyces sp. AS58]